MVEHMILITALSAALSADLFTFGIGYGLSGIRIPPLYSFVITVICVGMLTIGAALRSVIAPFIHPHMLGIVSCIILSAIGAIKLCQQSTDCGVTSRKNDLTFPESVVIGLAVSADGLAAGLATEFAPGMLTLMMIIFSVMSYASASGGNRLGFGMMTRHNTNTARRWFDRGAGVMLILIALSRLML
ncbi:hypothetical protein FACS1894133_7520 [Clostridia bacterium]|nr:hypothetical protein FACS1894133_7520 [Clostridia bacterium]